jgi:hypothetical protein
VLNVVVREDDEIARVGYAEAVSTDRKGREAAVSLFISDAAGTGVMTLHRTCNDCPPADPVLGELQGGRKG